MRLSHHALGPLTLTLLLTALPAAAAPIYFNDFQGQNPQINVGQGVWSNSNVHTMGSGNKFLGQFADQTVSLTFANRPEAQITVEFDLFIIGNWDGNTGPDKWELKVAGGPTLLSTTFSNRSTSQAYPGPYPGGNYPKYTGGTGYSSGIWNPAGTDDDYSLYHLTYSFYFAGGDLALQFSSDVNSPTQETFGLDNVSVDNHPVSEPAPWFLLGLGLIGLAICRKHFSLGHAERSMV